MTAIDHLLYGLAWASFGALHSLLAAAPGRALLGRAFGAGTRLAYNAIAVFHVAAIWAFGRFLAQGAAPFGLPLWAQAGLSLLALAGAALLLLGLREYDLGRFAGTWQLRHRVPPDAEGEDEPLVTGGFHRFVRHPLYTAAFMILWGLVRDPFSLATAAWASLYLVIGTLFEERKLTRLYGQAYRDYVRRVPRFIPWPRGWSSSGG
jgi:protein-S-isoprenylcysteine O-methyltransferase Ste14